MEQLESRVLFSGSVDTSSVHFFNAWGGAASLDSHKQIWLLYHGLNMSKDNMTLMAQGLQGAHPNDQVLIVDWSVLASTDNAPSAGSRRANSLATANWTASQLASAGIRASRVNLIGFSMGGEVIGDLAHALHTRHAMVNRLIALDPAGDGGFHFADNSSYAIAFTAGDKYSSQSAAGGADDTVLLAGMPSDDMARHTGTFGFFNTLVMREAGMEADDHLSQVFSTTNIMSGNLPAWKKNAFNNEFEAEIICQPVSGSDWRYEPTSATYVAQANSRRRVL